MNERGRPEVALMTGAKTAGTPGQALQGSIRAARGSILSWTCHFACVTSVADEFRMHFCWRSRAGNPGRAPQVCWCSKAGASWLLCEVDINRNGSLMFPWDQGANVLCHVPPATPKEAPGLLQGGLRAANAQLLCAVGPQRGTAARCVVRMKEAAAAAAALLLPEATQE